MTVSSLTGVIEFEDGTTDTFNFNDDITLTNASSYDADGDGDIEFELTLAPNASLQNDTDLGVNLGFQFDVVKASGGYDFVVVSGDLPLGPLFTVSDTADVANFDLYNNTFALNFGSGELTFAA